MRGSFRCEATTELPLSAYRKRGLAQIELKDYQSAIANYTQAIEINHRVNEFLNINFYQSRGNIYSLLGDSQKAAADYQKATEIETRYRSGEATSEDDLYDFYDDDSEDGEICLIISEWEQTDEK